MVFLVGFFAKHLNTTQDDLHHKKMVTKTSLNDESEDSYVVDDNEVDGLFEGLDSSSLES